MQKEPGGAVRIHALQARFGDSILVVWGSPKRAVLIDGGVGKTYSESIRPALAALKAEGIKALEALVVTHLDRDHIGGVAQVTRNRERNGLAIKDVWFNGERHLPAVAPRPKSVAQAEELGRLVVSERMSWNAAFAGRAIRTPARGPLPRVELPGGMSVTVLSPNLA
jgi:beta-lactamase superfamily II metal-dependent hydrolase